MSILTCAFPKKKYTKQKKYGIIFLFMAKKRPNGKKKTNFYLDSPLFLELSF